MLQLILLPSFNECAHARARKYSRVSLPVFQRVSWLHSILRPFLAGTARSLASRVPHSCDSRTPTYAQPYSCPSSLLALFSFIIAAHSPARFRLPRPATGRVLFSSPCLSTIEKCQRRVRLCEIIDLALAPAISSILPILVSFLCVPVALRKQAIHLTGISLRLVTYQ